MAMMPAPLLGGESALPGPDCHGTVVTIPQRQIASSGYYDDCILINVTNDNMLQHLLRSDLLVVIKD